jgi:hypothetical protein
MTSTPLKRRARNVAVYSDEQRQALTTEAQSLRAAGMKMTEIAKKQGVCYGTLQDWIYVREGRLKRNKKRRRPVEISHVVPTDDLPKAKRLARAGLPLDKAARSGHVSLAVLTQALKRQPLARPVPRIPVKLPPGLF